MAMRIVAIVVDENPSRPTGFQYAKNFADARGRIRPVVRRLYGNRVREKIRLPGNFVHFAGDEHQIFKIAAGAARVANHLVRNVHSHDAALRHQFPQPPRKPPRSAAHVENIVRRREPHFLEHRQRDRQVLLFHAFAAPRFRPTVELLAQRLVRLRVRHASFRGIRQLHCPAAGGTEARAIRRKRAAMRAESAGAYGNVTDFHGSLRSRGPDERDTPADDGPAEKEVHQKNTGNVVIAAKSQRGDRRQEIENDHKYQKLHISPPPSHLSRGTPSCHLNLHTYHSVLLFQLAAYASGAESVFRPRDQRRNEISSVSLGTSRFANFTSISNVSMTTTSCHAPAPWTLTSNSANFCLRSAWSWPDSASAICVMSMEQNFGPHMEQNLASL